MSHTGESIKSESEPAWYKLGRWSRLVGSSAPAWLLTDRVTPGRLLNVPELQFVRV